MSEAENDLDLCPINLISLCTGGGGLDLGFELAVPGARSVVLVERETYAIAQLVSAMEAGLMAPAPVWSDVFTFRGRDWRGAVDGVIGGIPCQPHSLAGKRLGEEDERDLWSDARRIIVQSGAWFCLIENVRGMVSSGGLERVWRDLRRLGFTVEVGLFTAEEVGASHERERVFILAVANPDRRLEPRRSAVRPEAASGRTYNEPARSSGGLSCGVGQADSSDTGLQGRELSGSLGERHGSEASGSTAKLRPAHLVDAQGVGRGEGQSESGFRSRRDTFAGASSAMADAEGGAGGLYEGPRPERSGTPVRRGTGAERDLVDTVGSGRDGGQAVSGPRQVGRTVDERSGGFPIFPPGPNDLSGWRDILDRAPEFEPSFRRVSDGLASRMDIARVDRLRMLGNGVVPLQAAYAVRTLAHRLAARGSAGAARLVRMMDHD